MEHINLDWVFNNPLIRKLLIAFLGLFILVVIIRYLQSVFFRYIKDTGARYKARKFVIILGYFAGILLLAGIFSDKLGGFHIALGMAGAGIAFSLQEVISSLAGWFAVSFGGFYKTGDRVQLGGIKGDVIDIGFLRTTIMEMGEWVHGDAYNGRVVRVANSFVFKEPVYNYSGDFPFLWDEINFPIKYGSDITVARRLLYNIVEDVVREYTPTVSASWKEMLRKYMIEDAQVEPMLFMKADENWITFTLRYVVDYKKRRYTKDQIFTRIIDEIDKSNGTVEVATSAQEISLIRKKSL